ncbi:MAG TPA: MurR/RpiR family transcriptional regulator [Stackebrandtia sp.]|jgi:DNA-binding MurR/RpiR family transcriptional regulator|uniref:MurR/RpiR family transcriptional regulator n=1 Tax=Stackebrandtia sp. TaxID=2023065 RepID=UPI002D4CA85C|nr:MurR/RpiR family transcriptional regulator [Stackebrandtia sp.]HZE40914.1 MurR/RpiR family transcriptional regulator [Stackebrandtia sp.]
MTDSRAPVDAAVAPGGVLDRISRLGGEFSEALTRVAAQVLADPTAAALSTIVELAERSGTSPATVTRFCRTLGYDGYAALRVAIATETGRAEAQGSDGWQVDIGREIRPDDPLERVLGSVLAAEIAALQDTAHSLDLDGVARAAEAIVRARRVDMYGIDGSALVIGQLQIRLHRIGIPAWSWSEVHGALASAALLTGEDVAIGFSHSGTTSETVEMLAEAGSHGALAVAVTSFPSSPVAEVADIVLTSATRASTSQSDVLAARHSQLLVSDILYLAVAQRAFPSMVAAFETTAQAVAGHRKDGLPLHQFTPIVGDQK